MCSFNHTHPIRSYTTLLMKFVLQVFPSLALLSYRLLILVYQQNVYIISYFLLFVKSFFKISFFKIKFQIQNDKNNNGDISSHYVFLFLIMHHRSFYTALVSNAYKFQIEKRIHHDSMSNPYLNNYYMISNYCSYFFLLFQPLNNCQFCIRKLTTIFKH